MLSGCMASYPVQPPEAVAPNARVTITFDSARDLEARHDATVHSLLEVRQIHGRVSEVRPDTLVLHQLGLESRGWQRELPGEARLTVATNTLAGISTRRLSKRRTAGLVAGLTVVGLLAFALANMDLSTPATGY